MSQQPKSLLLQILLQYSAERNQGLNQLAGHGTAEEQATAQILALFKDLTDQMIARQKPYKDGSYSYWVGQKDLRQELRQHRDAIIEELE